jgi:nucleoside-diphosphate-sugar epimerase
VRVLVTGSSGHLGEALMRVLPTSGHVPVGLDARDSSYADVVGSILDRSSVRRCLEGADAIIHTARLGWSPRCDFGHALARIAAGEDARSPLAASVGEKGYHAASVWPPETP